MPWKHCPNCGIQIPAHPDDGAASITHATTPSQYNQELIWRGMINDEKKGVDMVKHVAHAALFIAQAAKGQAEAPTPTIIHLLFERSVTPQGGIFSTMVATMGLTDTRDAMPSTENLRAMGYALLEGNKVQVVDDVPVGPVYDLLQYWGGEKQHRRWHLAQPIKLNPSKIGNPCFMDERMVAFEAVWRDGVEASSALHELIHVLNVGTRERNGVGPIANIRVTPP